MRIRYACSICGKEFSVKEECIEHEKSHTYELEVDSLCEGEFYTSCQNAQGIDLPAMLYVPVTHYLENDPNDLVKKCEMVFGSYGFVRIVNGLEMKQLIEEREAE